jgi:hypothetical protein
VNERARERILLGTLLLGFTTLLPAAIGQETGIGVGRVGELIASAAASNAEQDLIVAVEDATARLAVRLHELGHSGKEVADAVAMFWRWLTRDGIDAWAPARALAVALVMILLGGLAQVAALRATTKYARRWTRFSPSRVDAAVSLFMSSPFLPPLERPMRLCRRLAAHRG